MFICWYQKHIGRFEEGFLEEARSQLGSDGKQQAARRRAGMSQTEGEAAAKTWATENRVHLKNIKKFGIFKVLGGGKHRQEMRYARARHEGSLKN